MARIRSIKPEFTQSETIGNLSRDARLLFVQLWTYVDDEGRARGASRMLASLLFPYDHDAPELIEGWLAELQREGCIRRYEAKGSRYIDIPNWLKHQKIDHPGKSKIPPFEDGSEILANVAEGFAPDLGPRTRDLGPIEANASHDDEGADEPEAHANAEQEPKPSRMPRNYRISADDRAFAAAAGWSESEIDDGEAEYVDYWSNPKLPASKALKLNWSAVWRNRVRDLGKRRGANHRQPANVTPFRGGYDESRSTTAAAKRLLEESLRRDEEERWGAPLLAIGGPSGGEGPDGVLPEGRGGRPEYLRSFGG